MIEVWIDGGCSFNPGGTATIGVYIKNCKFSQKISEVVGSGEGMTNNVAEFAALLRALEVLKAKNLNQERIKIYTDSNILANKVKSKTLNGSGAFYSWWLKCRCLLADFSNLTAHWVPREQNRIADKLTHVKLKKRKAPVITSFAKSIKNQMDKEYQSIFA